MNYGNLKMLFSHVGLWELWLGENFQWRTCEKMKKGREGHRWCEAEVSGKPRECQKRQRSHSLRLLLHVELSALPVEESRTENPPLDGARTEALPRWLPLMGILFVKTPNV